jgi:WD40 repeat protein
VNAEAGAPRGRLRLRATLQLAEFPVDAVWAPDARTLLVGLADGALALLEIGRPGGTGPAADTQGLQMRRLSAHDGAVLAVAWQRAGNVFASSGQDGAVLLWDARTLAPRTIHRAAQWSERLSFAADGRWLAVGTGRMLTLFDAQGEAQYRHAARSGAIAALAWRPRSLEIAAAGNGGLQLHRVGQAASAVTVRDYPLRGACVTAAFNPDGRLLATGLQDGAVQLWNLATGSTSRMAGYASRVFVTEWSASGRYLATAAGTTLAVWDFSGKGPEGSRPLTLEEHSERITALAFRPSGTWLASAARDRRLLWWRVGAGSGQPRPLDAQLLGDECGVLHFSPDGARLAVADASGRLTVYECEP